MRIVHTSDWHAGRVWKSRSRLEELARLLDHLGRYIEREAIDLVLMSGDVFDSASPSADAERLVTEFFRRLGKAGVPSVVIAGNHDSPARLEAWGLLAEFVGVQTRGLPRARSAGGLIQVGAKNGEVACVAAVPFAPVGRLVEALTLAHDETLARQQYADAMRQILAHLADGFTPSSVNLVIAHTHVSGAQHAGSERVVTLGDDWAATPQSIPATAQYVALGHIHRPQRMQAAGPHTEYAGSPMQLDFGEVADDKTFAVIDVIPGRPPRVERVPYEGAASLGDFVGTWPELEASVDRLSTFGFLRVRVTLDAPMPELNRRVRQMLPNVVVVDAVLPELSPAGPEPGAVALHAPVERFKAYYQRRHQAEPRGDTIALFNELYAAAETE
ncbi:MAG: exonuclease SbcCD subunit D [Acidobacteria bacterium]|nr:exonuclease SbcCD subunit D [Acidobacteriota bacterium]